MRRAPPLSVALAAALSIALASAPACQDASATQAGPADGADEAAGEVGDLGDATTSDASGDAATDDSGDLDESDLAEVPSCEGSATDDVETVASRWATATDQAMEARGLTRTSVLAHDVLTLRQVETDALREAGTLPPVLVRSEAELLALPDDHPLRRAVDDGEVELPEWGTQALLAYYVLAPYTDTRLYGDAQTLVVAQLRLQACLDAGHPPDPPPAERATLHVARIEAVASVSHEVATASFRMPDFAPDPAWERDPNGPFIWRAGGGGAAVETAEGFELWVEGYSGASGFLFRATSADGAAWDFAWDDAHLCTFEGMADIEWYKTSPVVMNDPGGTLTMWLHADSPEGTNPGHLYRTTSVDGLAWSQPEILRGLGADELWPHSVVRDEDGRFHLYVHRVWDRTILHTVSDDGLTWEPPEVILERGESPFDLDSAGVFEPFVVRDGATWAMFYTAVYSPRETRTAWGLPLWYQMHVALATSADGLTWVRSPRPLLSQIRTPGHWESGSFGGPLVLPPGGGDWLMLYTGVEGGEPSVARATATGWSP